MADALTPTHKLTLPEIGSSKETWGSKLNNNFTVLDGLLTADDDSLFFPRAGGDVTGAVRFMGHPVYSVLAGQSELPLTIRRKTDSVIAYRFDPAQAIAGTTPTLDTVLNARMGDARYLTAAGNNNSAGELRVLGNPDAQARMGEINSPWRIIRVSDNLATHMVHPDDVTNPDTAAHARSILTRVMGDNRFALRTLTLTGGDGLSTIGDLTANRTISVDATVARRNANNVFGGTVTTQGNLVVRSDTEAGSTHIYLQSLGGTMRGLIYAANNSDLLTIRAHNIAGTAFKDLVINGANGNVVAPGDVYAENFRGAFVGSGAGLTGVPANVLTGTVPDARLSGNVVFTHRSVGAGNGLVGGGNFSADRNIALGAPGTINEETTNTVYPQSHTHAFDNQTIPKVNATLGAGGLGTYALLKYTGGNDVNPGTNVIGSSLRYTSASADEESTIIPPGTWKTMGYSHGTSPMDRTTLFLRIA